MVSDTRPSTLDPLVKPEPEPEGFTETDFADHVKTYNRFLALARTFILHMAILLVALYFAVIAGNSAIAILLVLVSIGILIGGALRQKPVRSDAEAMLGAGPGNADASDHRRLAPHSR